MFTSPFHPQLPPLLCAFTSVHTPFHYCSQRIILKQLHVFFFLISVLMSDILKDWWLRVCRSKCWWSEWLKIQLWPSIQGGHGRSAFPGTCLISFGQNLENFNYMSSLGQTSIIFSFLAGWSPRGWGLRVSPAQDGVLSDRNPRLKGNTLESEDLNPWFSLNLQTKFIV